MLVTPYLAALSRLAPVAAGLGARGRLTGARAWVLVWCTIQVAADLVALLLDRDGHSTQWIQYCATPLEGATILWALSLWQRQALARLTLRLAIPLFLVAFGVLVALGDPRGATPLAGPVYTMLALGAALYTLGTRGHDEAESLWQSDWFWMCGGLMLYFGSGATLVPVGAVVARDHPELVIRASEVKSLVDIVAFAALTIGALCPLPQPYARASLSQASLA